MYIIIYNIEIAQFFVFPMQQTGLCSLHVQKKLF